MSDQSAQTFQSACIWDRIASSCTATADAFTTTAAEGYPDYVYLEATKLACMLLNEFLANYEEGLWPSEIRDRDEHDVDVGLLDVEVLLGVLLKHILNRIYRRNDFRYRDLGNRLKRLDLDIDAGDPRYSLVISALAILRMHPDNVTNRQALLQMHFDDRKQLVRGPRRGPLGRSVLGNTRMVRQVLSLA